MKGHNIFEGWLRIVAIVVVLIGLVLTIEGFLIAPAGEIHHSVLIYFGECLIFVGSVPIIEHHVKNKNKRK